MSLLIKGGTLYTPRQEIPDASILLDAGKILAVGNSDSMPIEKTTETLQVPGHRVIPGLIDVHLHGVKGFDVSGPGLAQVSTMFSKG